MGFSLVWFAAHGIPKDDLLERAGFEDTGEVDTYFEEDHSGGELPGGWYVMVSNDLGVLAPEKLAAWSAGGRLVAAVVHEDTMNSLATEWQDGRQVWSVSHDGADGGDELAIEGQLPALFDVLKEEAAAAHVEAEADASGEADAVDFAFDIPLDLAADITGFRHDEMGFDDDIPLFTALERIHPQD